MKKLIIILMLLTTQVYAAKFKILHFDEPISGYKRLCEVTGYSIYQYGDKAQSSILSALEISAELTPYATDTKIKLSVLGRDCSKIVIEGPNKTQKVYLKASDSNFYPKELPN
jgi:hypothetical protein